MKQNVTRAARVALATAALIAAPATAHAHLVNTTLGDFYSGMLHPLTGPDDLLPWIALALLAGIQGAARARFLSLVFPLALLAGGGLALAVPGLPALPGLSLALTAFIGLAVAGALAVPMPALILLGAITALVTGYQNGQAITALVDHALGMLGVAAVGYVVMTLLIGMLIAFLRDAAPWRTIAIRAAGSWIAAIGIMVLGLQLFRPVT